MLNETSKLFLLVTCRITNGRSTHYPLFVRSIRCQSNEDVLGSATTLPIPSRINPLGTPRTMTRTRFEVRVLEEAFLWWRLRSRCPVYTNTQNTDVSIYQVNCRVVSSAFLEGFAVGDLASTYMISLWH